VVLDGVLRADTSTLPAWVGIDMTSQGYSLARITQVIPRKEVDAQASQQDRAQFTQLLGRAEAEAYYQMLKLRYKVQINAPKPGIKPVAPTEAG
jgi:peptidyl-prolyl cis-trans isomerase D